MLVLRVSHQLKKSHFYRGRYDAACLHFCQTGELVMLESRTDAIGQKMHLEAAVEQVVRRLVDANVRFEAAQDNLFDTKFLKLFDKRSCTARAKCCLFKYFETVGQNKLYLLCGAAQAFWILFSNEDRNTEDLKPSDRRRCQRSDERKIRD